MRKKILLHVGHGKTGSSAIQSMLARNTATLARHGIAYPDHPSLTAAREGMISSGNLDHLPDWAGHVHRVAERADAPAVIFSNELLFWDLPTQAGLGPLAAEHDLCVVAFLRDPLDYAFSRYGQDVKRDGETSELDDWMRRDRTIEDVRDVLRFLQAAGIETRLRNYSAIAPRLLPEFAAMIGLPPDALNLALPRPRINRSMTRAELFLQRAFNRHFGPASSVFVSDVLVNELPGIVAENWPLSRAAYDDYVARNAGFLDEINRALPASEPLRMAPYDPAWATPLDEALGFSGQQIDRFASSISARLFEQQEAIARVSAQLAATQAEVQAARSDADRLVAQLRDFRRHPFRPVGAWVRHHAARLAAPVAGVVSRRAEERLRKSSAKRDPAR